MATRNLTVKTGSLQLDAHNARIPADRRSTDQRQLLHELLEHEDVRSLAASIAKLGLFPNERLVVVADGRRYTVLEGNRRLAAIRLLINPELAPSDAQVRYYRNLSAKANLTEISKLDVAVVASRIAAAPIIAALHTREAKKRWSSLQQARFYRELVDEGQTPAEVAEQVGVTLGQVASYLRAEALYRAALTLDYSVEVRDKLENPKFPLTTLERFIESKIGRKFLGIELDEMDGFRGAVHPDRFRAVLTRVATDVATRKGLTREINNDKGFEAYVAKWSPKIPKTRVRGSFTAAEIIEGADPAAADTKPRTKKPKTKRPPRPSTSVVPRLHMRLQA